MATVERRVQVPGLSDKLVKIVLYDIRAKEPKTIEGRFMGLVDDATYPNRYMVEVTHENGEEVPKEPKAYPFAGMHRGTLSLKLRKAPLHGYMNFEVIQRYAHNQPVCYGPEAQKEVLECGNWKGIEIPPEPQLQE
ncbi:hypothetical protein ACFL1B_04765 [Nanoarchaeota archaeon]